jgi:hypothetical protein
MKKNFLCLLCFSILFFYSCKNKEKKEETSSSNKSTQTITNLLNCGEAGGLGNFLLHPDTATKMIQSFKTNYDKYSGKDDIKALVNEHWMDSCTIFAISKFLKNNEIFDGIRFFFTANTIDDNNFNQGIYKNQTSLAILATIGPKNKRNYGHSNQFNLIDYLNCANGANYIKRINVINSEKFIFDKVYRKNINKDTSLLLSEGVWIDSCVIFAMESLIKDPRNQFDGINIHLAAYIGNETYKPKGMEKSKQSTLIFALTENKNGAHISNFTFLNDLINLSKKENKILGDYKFNHGELCPKICDTIVLPL